MKFKIKEKENVVRISCPDCRKLFYKLSSLNKHIVKSGHNEAKKYTELDVVKFIFKLKVTQNQIILSIPS